MKFLGDLLLPSDFYAQMAEEEQHFNFDDIARGIVEKMLRPSILMFFRWWTLLALVSQSLLTEGKIAEQWQN